MYYKPTGKQSQTARCSGVSDAQFMMWRIPMSTNWAVIQSSSVTLDHDACALPPVFDFRKATAGRGRKIMTQLTLKRSTSDDLQAWNRNRDPAVCFPGSRWTMCHIISAATGNQRASSFPQPADVLKPSAVRCVIVNPVTLAVMWPKMSLPVRPSASHLWIQHSHAAPCIDPR